MFFCFYGKIFEKLGKGKKDCLKVDCFVREVISRRVENKVKRNLLNGCRIDDCFKKRT